MHLESSISCEALTDYTVRNMGYVASQPSKHRACSVAAGDCCTEALELCSAGFGSGDATVLISTFEKVAHDDASNDAIKRWLPWYVKPSRGRLTQGKIGCGVLALLKHGCRGPSSVGEVAEYELITNDLHLAANSRPFEAALDPVWHELSSVAQTWKRSPRFADQICPYAGSGGCAGGALDGPSASPLTTCRGAMPCGRGRGIAPGSREGSLAQKANPAVIWQRFPIMTFRRSARFNLYVSMKDRDQSYGGSARGRPEAGSRLIREHTRWRGCRALAGAGRRRRCCCGRELVPPRCGRAAETSAPNCAR